jgi:predicted porin
MSNRIITAALLPFFLSPALSRADGTEQSMFSFKGFGTIGIAHSSEDQADFKGNIFQPNGAGYTRDWDMGVDSKIGAQVSANFTDKFSGIIQAVAQHQFDNSYRPLLEWANLKYQVTNEFSVRGGRIVLPSLLQSESRFVGYAQPWIRPPEEIYFVSSITSSDGGDITYRSQIGEVTNSVQAFYGNSTAKLSTGKIKAKPAWGINDLVEVDSWTLRAAFVSLKLDLDLGSIDPLINGLNTLGNAANTFGFNTAGSDALDLADKYDLKGMQVRIYSLGANYDPGDWFVMAEYAKFDGDGFLQDSDSGYITGGYRIDKFTPYATYGKIKTHRVTEDGIDTTGTPGALATGADSLSAGVNATLKNFANSQTSYSVGLRWDFMPSVDLKIQYDHLKLEDDTFGRLSNAQPGFDGDSANVISAAIDFVF